MKKMWEALKKDKELQQLRKEWEEKFTGPFPPWNYDCYSGLDDYKQKIRDALESGDCRKADGTVESKFKGIL